MENYEKRAEGKGMKKIKEYYQKYEEMIRYLIIGGFTTVISLVTKYALLFTILDAKKTLELQISIVISWIVSVTFAYIANRTFVFQSKNQNILREISLFVSARVVTLLMESFLSWFFITFLKLNSDFSVIILTILIQGIVIIDNYVFSKIFVFQQKEDKK